MVANTVSTRAENGRYETHYDWPTIIPAVLDRIKEGEGLTVICEDPDLPSRSQILEHCLLPEYVDRYRIAQAVLAEVEGLSVDEVPDKVATGEFSPNQGKVIADIKMRRMGHRAPKQYNDKVISQTVQHTVQIDLTMRGRLERAQSREVARLRSDTVTEAEYEVIEQGDGVGNGLGKTSATDTSTRATPHETPASVLFQDLPANPAPVPNQDK
jgi:hypothetical protein